MLKRAAAVNQPDRQKHRPKQHGSHNRQALIGHSGWAQRSMQATPGCPYCHRPGLAAIMPQIIRLE
jgi:hypothetical protein